MPNRILKESVCRSKNLNNLSPGAEILFYRLLVSADDFGRFDADAMIILGHCFPRKLGSIQPVDISAWLKELEEQNIIKTYEIEDMTYFYFVTWESHQQMRAKYSKFPAPDSDSKHLLANDSNSPRIRESRTYKEKGEIDRTDPEKYVKGKLGHMVQR